MYWVGTYLGDLFANRLDLIESLAEDGDHLLRELAVGLCLRCSFLLFGRGSFLFLRLGLRLGDVLKQGAFADLVTIVVNNIAIVVNSLADQRGKITRGQLANKVSIRIADFAFLGDLAPRHGVDNTLLLLGLPALSFADCVAVLVEDITILVNLAAEEALGVTFNQAPDDLLAVLHDPVLADDSVVESVEWSFSLVLLSPGDELGTSNNLAIVPPDLALAVDLASSEALITFDNASDHCTSGGVNNVSSLVDNLALQDRQVFLGRGFLLGRLIGFSTTFDIAVLIGDLAILVDSSTTQLLGVTFNKLTDNGSLVIFDESIFGHEEALHASEGTLGLALDLILGNELNTANDLLPVVDLAILDLLTGKLLGIPLHNTGNWISLGSDDIPSLVA